MADKKISDLPPTASVNTDDTFEKSLHNAAPSERMTVAQLVTFLQTAMTLLQLSGGNIKFNADGSGSLGRQNFADGTLSLLDALTGSNMIVLSGNDGSGNFAQGQSSLNGDGSARFASGAATIAADGSASFGSGSVSITGGGAVSWGSSVSILASSGDIQLGIGPFMVLSAADGSATFSNGGANIDGSGNLSIQGNQVVTSRQPAIADATNAVDVITQFNTLLAELRTHGLIAT